MFKRQVNHWFSDKGKPTLLNVTTLGISHPVLELN